MIGTDLDVAISFLKKGELVAIPTETVYGLAANALDSMAVSKIFAAKERPSFNPLIVHLSANADPNDFVFGWDKDVEHLSAHFWPGPLSILLKKKDTIPDIVTSGMDSVVLRKPAHPLTQKLLEKLPFPLAAPSANKFKQISPTKAAHVEKSLGSEIAYILDGGDAKVGVESTIIDCRTKPYTLLRHGGISKEEIEKLVGPINEQIKAHSNPLAPGQMDQHYSTSKPLQLSNDLAKTLKEKQGVAVSVIYFGKLDLHQWSNTYCLSESENLIEAAAHLFNAMHLADQDNSELIIVGPIPNKGIGRAINDRLMRASH